MKTLKTLVAASALLVSATTLAGVDTATNSNDVILAGHDAVAYFTQGKPTLGQAKYTAAYDGAVYRFASAQNRDLFRASPEKYAPAYGGYCAFGTSVGKKFDVDGKAFQIVSGRLYVNKNLDVYQTWKKDVRGNVVKAEGTWPGIRNTPAASL